MTKIYNNPEVDALIAQVESLNLQVAELYHAAKIWQRIEQEGIMVYDTELGIDRKAVFIRNSGDSDVGLDPFYYWELEAIGDD